MPLMHTNDHEKSAAMYTCTLLETSDSMVLISYVAQTYSLLNISASTLQYSVALLYINH